MTDEYTPDTEEVRDSYAIRIARIKGVSFDEAARGFDHFIRKVKADAWAECYDLWALGPAGDFPDREENPYL